ncbi:hypothetical protein [Piscinibacterium candidicorallinum]|uniref:hypothetical protein n=1 Tax=Piscinibacterium candidicorallinum TaxID=1793872 RepID=UPI00367198AB
MPLLARTYHAFGGDMVAALIMGEIAHRNVEHWLADESNSPAPLEDPAVRLSMMRPCNALSIADACGLPRETVRRKVNWLIERTYVKRSDDGHLYLTVNAGDDFDEMTAQNVQAVLDTADRLRRILAQTPTASCA